VYARGTLSMTNQQHFHFRQWKNQTVSAIGILTTAVGFIFGNLLWKPPEVERYPDDECYSIVRPDATVTLDLAQQLNGRQGSDYAGIEQVLGAPHCILPKVTVRYGSITERHVFRTSENARLIVAYENGQYLGHAFENLEGGGEWRRPDAVATEVEFSRRTIEQIELKNTWGVQAGNQIDRYPIVSGLGDISLKLSGEVLAPFDGYVKGKFVLVTDGNLIRNTEDCVLFSSPQIPAYTSKICGLERRYLGRIEQGKPLGKTDGYVHVSLLSLRREGSDRVQWVYVSPSSEFLQRLVNQS